MVDSLATIYVKKPFHVGVGSDGIEEAIAGCILPPYVIPSRYWIKTRIITDIVIPVDASNDATNLQPYRISGRVGDFQRDFLTDANPPSAGLQLLTDLMEEFLPHEPGSVGDNVQDTQVDVGLPGSGVVPIQSQEFFSRDKWLGLPQNGLVVDTDLIRYVDYFSAKGMIKNSMVGRYDQATIIGFGMTLDNFDTEAESDDALFGGPANSAPQLEVLLEEILDKIAQNTVGDTPMLFSTGMGDTALLNSQALQWQTGAYGTSVTGNSAVKITTVLTVQCDVRIPQYSEHLIVRG